MTRDQLLEKSLGDLREIAKLQGVKSITKYRKGELVDIIMNGGSKLSAVKPKAEAEEKAGAVSAPSAPQRTEEAPSAKAEPVPQAQTAAPQQAQPAPAPSAPQGGIPPLTSPRNPTTHMSSVSHRHDFHINELSRESSCTSSIPSSAMFS